MSSRLPEIMSPDRGEPVGFSVTRPLNDTRVFRRDFFNRVIGTEQKVDGRRQQKNRQPETYGTGIVDLTIEPSCCQTTSPKQEARVQPEFADKLQNDGSNSVTMTVFHYDSREEV